MIPGQPRKTDCQVRIFVWTIAIILVGAWVYAAELKVNPSTTFFVPVHMDTQQAIYSCDIRVQFDTTRLKAIGATLKGTILEGRGYQLVQNVGLTGEARFPVYSSGNLYTGKGIVLYIEFEPLVSPGEQSMLQLIRFRCNETDTQGGLWVQDSFSSEISIVVNNLPEAYDQTKEIMEDEPTIITLTASDADISDTFSYTIDTAPTLGTVLLSETTGQLTYTPNPDIFGTEHFTYMVSDGTGLSNPGHITIIIRSGNDLPLGKPATVEITEDTPENFSLLAVDSDNDPITYELQTPPAKGTLTLLDSDSGACRYTPETNDFATYHFTFIASDSYGDSAPTAMTIIILPVNDAPVAIGTAYTLNEDESLETQLQGFDDDSGTLTYEILEFSQEVSIEIIDAQRGTIKIIPGKNINGAFQFTFQVSDGLDSSEPATVNLVVLPENDPPVGSAGTIHLDEDTPKIFQISGLDIENDPLSYAIHMEPERGTLSLNEQSGECHYTPPTDESGLFSFMFTTSDGQLTSEPVMFTLIIDPVNDPPVAQNNTIETLEDTSIEITLQADDIDSAIEAFSIMAFPDGHLELIDPSTGLCQYTPLTNYFGPDIFSFMASDAESTSQPGLITIHITPVNDPPVASSMSITANEDQVRTITLNTFDPDGDPITFTMLSNPDHGEVSNFVYENETMTVQYKPYTDYYGSDQFSYELNDGQYKSSIAVVDIDVLYVNDPPFVQSDIISVAEDESVSYTLKAYDEDSQITGFKISENPSHGQVLFTNDQTGAVVYTPNKDYFGSDAFSYQCMDDASESEPAVISITVKPVNDLPIGYAKTFMVDEDIPITGNLSFEDPDYDMLTITVFTEPDHGALTITDRRTGAFVYHPEENFSGDDYILFEACDDVACSGPIAMTFTIRPINDLPVAFPQSLTLNEDQPLRITLTGYDVENLLTEYEIAEYPSEGLLEIIDATAGLFQYIPERDKYGSSSFLFQVRDDIQTSAPAMVTMTILPINDPPEATASAYTLLEDNSFDGTLEKFDADGDELTLKYSPPQHGWISFFDPKSGDFSYLPSSNYNGNDYFSYTVCDMQSCSVQTRITLTIQPDNDIPVVSSASYELDEDTALSLTLTAMDIDMDVLTFEITQPTEGILELLDAQTGACVYSPIAENSGEVQFTYRVFDGLAYSDEAEIQLTIIPVNDDPIAFSDEIEIEEDQTYSGKVMAEDVDDEDLQYFISQKPMKGNLVISESGIGQGNFIYSPYANENGLDIFWFYVFDGDANSAPQPFTISIHPVNDPPKAEDFMAIVNAGEIKECVLNASDPDVDPITYTIIKEPEKGSVQFFDQQTGKIEYFADENSTGEDIITFRVSDGKLSSEDANLIISINPLDNYQPVANPMALTVTEGISSYFTLDASDTDNNPLTYHIFQEPGKGTLTFDEHSGESTYESNLNAQGMDYIVYYVNDGIVNSDPAQITLFIQPMPEAVVPKQDILSIPVVIKEEKSIASINIQVKFDPNEMEVLDMTLDNTILDSGDYGFSTQIGTNGIAVFPISSQGTSITGKGVVAYLRFKILGNEGDIVLLELPKLTCNESRIFGGFELKGSISSKIRLIINEIPIAYDGNIVMDEEQILDYPLVGYDLNSDDPVSFTILSYPEKITLTLVDAQTGLCILSGNLNEYGADSFVYQSFDGKDYSRPANMSIQINPINDRPVAYPISLTVLEDMPRSITLLGEDPADPEDTLIFRIVQKPTNGVGILLYPFEGVYIYENNENHYGMDSFTYVVDDFIDKSEPVTVNINVIPVNDAPIPKSVTYTTQEDTTFEFDLAAEDPENDIFEFILLENTNMGTLEFNSVNGHCSYQPNATISGRDSFIIQVKDIHNAISEPTTIYILITPENDPPVVTSVSSFEIMEDTTLSETMTAFDQDQDDITFIVKSQPAKGTLKLSASGEFTYTPFQDQTGNDIFIVAAKDPYVESESVPITVNILQVNDPPKFEKGGDQAVLEDAGKQIIANWAKNISAGADNESDQILSFHVTPDNAALFAEQPRIDSAGTLTYVPNNDVSGETLVSVFLQDDAEIINGGNNTSATIQFTIRIINVNDAPSFTVGQKHSVQEDSARIDIPNWVTVMTPGPTNESNQALIFHLSTDNESLFQQIPAVYPSGMLSFTPMPDQFGEAVVSISLQDDGGTLNGGIDTSITQTFVIEITPVNDPPVANAGTSYEVQERHELKLDGQGSSDIDSDILTYLWTIPNNSGFEIQNETTAIATITAPYVETSSESFTVTLTVTDDNNVSAIDTALVLVTNMTQPEVSFSADPVTGTAPLSVQFTDTSIGMPESWVWNFGDNASSFEQHPLHVYKKSGVYTIALTVTGPGGTNILTQTEMIQVDASTQPLEIDFSVNQSEGFVPFDVQFTPEITGEVTQWQWNFGDGSVSNDFNAAHTYAEIGAYTVTLIAQSQDETRTKTYEDFILVKGHVLKGTVSNEDSKKLADYRVEAYLIDTYAGGAQTDENGHYTIAALLPSNQYIVGVWPPENDTQYVYQYYNNVESLFDASYIEIEGETILDFTMSEAPRRWLTGRLTDGSNPIPYTQVDIYSDRLGLSKNATTDANGVYTITGLKESSDYRVSFYSDALETEFFYYSTEMSVKTISQARQISPTEEGLTDIDIIVNALQGGKIEGQVTDISGNAISGMRVNAWADSLNAGGSAITDDDGHYVITGLTPSDSPVYILEIQPDGFMYQVYNNNTKTPVATGSTGINFELQDKASLSGTIKNTVGQNIANARVQIYSQKNPSGSTKETYSSENGTYTFTDLPIRNDYILQVDADGYPVHYFENTTDLNNATLFSLETGSKTGLNIDLDKGMVIKGKVYDQTFDVPVASGTKVTLRSDSLGLVKTAPTDDTGYFEFSGLDTTVSDYILSVIIDNYLPAYYRDNHNLSDEDDTVYKNSEAQAVQALAYNDAKICHIVLVQQGMVLTGLVSSNGTPISGAIVKIQSDEGSWKTTTTNHSAINYTISGILPDSYTIEVTSNAYVMQGLQIAINTDTSQDFILQKLPLRTIQGTVFNLEQDKQIQLLLQSLSKNVQETMTLVGTGQAYAYSFNGLLPASDYTLELKSTDYSNQYYNNVYQSDDATNIDILNNDITDIDFTIATALAEITGRIDFPANATNGDIVRVEVKSNSTGIEGFIDITLIDNLEVDYKISGLLPSDDYILQVRSDTYLNRYWNGTNAYGTKYVENALPVSTMSGSATANLSLNPGFRIEGTVKNASGDLLEGIQIDVWSDKEKVAAITHTLNDGSYSISGLDEANDYQIKATTATNAKFYYFNETESVQIPGDAALVSTKTGDQFNMNIIISKGETIAGKVRGVNGQAISGIWINAWSETIGVGGGVFSSDDGSFEILDLPKAQDYRISAKPEWNQPYLFVEQNNIAAPSSGIDLVLPDKTGFTVSGTIKDETGAPVKDATVEIQSASKSDQFGWNKTDINGQYTIDLLPEGSDYAFKVKPPHNSNLAYSEQTISISANLEINVILEAGYVFSGTIVAKDTQTNLADAEITVWSDTTHFIGEATTNINGEFSIANVPNQSDYVVSVKADDYLELKRENQSPKKDIVYTVEQSGLIQGTVRSLLTGEVLPEASIEIYSQANQGLDVYNGVAATDQDGHYSVGGLKPVDEQGNNINDFVVTVYATGFPPVTKTGKQLGDTVSFDLTKGPENEISGNIENAGSRAVAIDVFEVIQQVPSREDKFVKTVMANDDASFLIDGLRADGQFVFKFVTDDNHEQWAGENNTGVDLQSEAKVYQTQTEINFQFTNLRKRSKISSNKGPGPVQGLKSLSHSYKLMNVRIRAVKSNGPDKPSNDANVTVAWDPPDEGTSDLSGYYHFFDKVPEKKVNKFTIDAKPPIRTRKITSRDLAGDDVNYYFHVASVDKEGRVGDTTSIAFRIDTTPPSNVNVTAPKSTNRQRIGLKLGATGASEMYISNLSYAEGGQWESRSIERVWRLTNGDGSKKIYTRFRDKAGNEAKAAAITLYQPPLPVYTIQAEAWSNGDISPEGDVFVTQGEDITFTLTPDTDYLINQLLLDDTPQSIDGNTFTLSNVQKPHHVVATFKEDNEAPIAYDKTIDIIEDTPTEFTLSAYDPDGDILEYKADNPEKGNLQLLEGNRYSYAPDNNDFGKYTFQFTVSDGELTSNTGTVTLNIISKNDPPEIVPINVYPDLNSAIAITLTASDVDSNNFSYTISSPPINGQATIQGNIVTYTPNAGYQGKDAFTYLASDGVDDSEMAEVTLWVGVSEADLILDEDVTTLITSISYASQIIDPPEKGSVFHINQNRIVYVPQKDAYGEDSFTYSFEADPKTYTFTIFIKEINDAPWFTSANAYTVKEDYALQINLSAYDIENNPLVFGIDQRPEKGQLTANGALLTYTPAENFNGTVTMIAWVKDPYTTVNQEISIDVEPVNDAPVAHNYFDHGGLSNSISFTLTANDIDGDSLTYHIDSKPASGSLTGSGQHWTYTPDLQKPRHEEISFIANDGKIDSNVGYIYLYFGMDVVHAYGDEDKSINIREGLEKFHGISNDESIEITVAPESGQIQADQYIPDKDFFGADQFEFKAQGKTDIFKIYMIAVDDPPVITGPDTIETPEDISKDIVFTVEDVDSKSLVYTLISNVSHGELSGTTTRYTYTPEHNYYGDDTMTLQVSDGNSIARASVSITIHPINDAPVGKNQSLSMYEDQQLSIQLSGYDPENLPLTDFEIAMTPVHGTLSNSTSMTDWVYRPDPNYNGSDSFTFTLSDGQLTSAEATVNIQIRNVNDLPYANGRSITMTDSNSISGYLYAYDHPLDHDTLIYSLQSNAKKGMVVVNNPVTGAFTYYPNNYATGVDYFTFKVNDGYADSNTATMMIYISSPVSDLLRLIINLHPPYDGRSYHYLIRDVIQGIVVREDDANTRQMEHQLAKGQYQVIIRSEGFALYASPEPIDLTSNKSIGIALTQGNSPPDITMPDISHKMISGGFLLKMIPNQDKENPFELFIIDNTQGAVEFKSLTTENLPTYQWLENPDALNGLYTDTLPDYPSPDDTMYTINVQIRYDGFTVADYPITYISYASSENAEQNKPEDQKVFESTYGPSESVEFSNKLFYPLLGENLRIVVSDTQGQDIEIPIRIPSLPLSCLYIDNTLNYDDTSDYYDIAASSSQTLTPQTQLLAKIKHYTFGKDSLGSGVDISFVVAETGEPVRYNPVYNNSGQRADQVNSETAPDIEVPLLLNPESDHYTSFREDLLASNSVDLFYNEKGDGTNGFKLNASTYTIDQKNKDLVKLSTNHLTGIGFAVQQAEEQAPEECDDCDSSCFVGLLTGSSSFGFVLWLSFLAGCIVSFMKRKICDRQIW
jgi:PKD repeat protein